jgi:alkylation response protein AidB-like acyl-CoA dehydrogenase
MISFELESDQTLIQETVHGFAKDELSAQARACEKAGAPSPAIRRSHTELGLARLDLPEAHGGQGATLTTMIVAEEELGWGDAPLALALDGGYAGELFLSLADKAHMKPGADTLTAFAYCEPKGPVTGFGTVARRVDGGFELNGNKGWVIDGGRATRYVVLAQLDGVEGWRGAAAFLVDKKGQKDGAIRAGARQTQLGLAAVEVCDVMFEGCRIADAQLIASGDDLVATMRRTLARIGLKNAARQVGLARAAYELSLDYTQDRKAFGRPVAHFQANAFCLADMATEVDSARWMVWRAASALDHNAGAPTAEQLRWVADAIVQAADVAWRTSDRGVQLLGGAGFVQDFPAEKRMRDTKALALVGAPVEWWRLDAAAHHLGHDLDGALPSATLQPFVL